MVGLDLDPIGLPNKLMGLGDRGIEADNNGDNNSASPFSNPTLQNITLTGYVGSESDGMKLREGTKGRYFKCPYIEFSGVRVEVEHEVTVKNAGSGDLTLSGISVTGSTGSIYAIKGAANASDSTNAASAIDQAIDGSATGAGTDWINGWTQSL